MMRVPELRLLLEHLVEVDAGVVLVETRRHLVLGVLHRQPLRVDDALARLVVLPEGLPAGRDRVEAREVELRRHEEVLGADLRGQLGRVVGAGVRAGVALVDHRPAVELEDRLVALVVAAGVHPDDADVRARRLAAADDLGLGMERVAGEDGRQEADIGVAEVGGGVEGDIGHGAAEDHVEDEHVVHDLALEAERARELAGAVERAAVAGDGDVHRHVALGDGARARRAG